MVREIYNDLSTFMAVAKAGSFTRAAAQLGVSQSALSHTMRNLEARVGVRLLARTTRNVGLTEAGERLMASITPHFEGITEGLAGLDGLRERPAGTIRITTNEHAAAILLYPVVSRLMRDYPEINVEISVDSGFVDLVSHRFDAGVRLGDLVEKDMVAVRIGPNMRMAIVGSPDYFTRHPVPQAPEDLLSHNCIGHRMPTYGNLLPWEFDRDGKSVTVRVTGQFICNSGLVGHRALLEGIGLGYCPEDVVEEEIRDGRLIRVLDEWCEPFAGYQLYYPSRRQHSPAFQLLVDALRYRD